MGAVCEAPSEDGNRRGRPRLPQLGRRHRQKGHHNIILNEIQIKCMGFSVPIVKSIRTKSAPGMYVFSCTNTPYGFWYETTINKRHTNHKTSIRKPSSKKPKWATSHFIRLFTIYQHWLLYVTVARSFLDGWRYHHAAFPALKVLVFLPFFFFSFFSFIPLAGGYEKKRLSSHISTYKILESFVDLTQPTLTLQQHRKLH